MSANVDLNDRPDYDRVLQTLADYALGYRVDSAGSPGHRAQLPDGHPRLRPAGPALP